MKPAAIISQQTACITAHRRREPAGLAVLALENTVFRTIQTERENKQQRLSNYNLMKYVNLQTETKDPEIKHHIHALSQHILKTLVSLPRVHYFNF